ncbi:MAG TPA: hypothetical protein PLC65_01090 [Bacteroidia bacterium]|nr:hypothetical protein [Bacteroidia bacterium]
MKNLKVFLENLEASLPSGLTLNKVLIKELGLNKDAASRRISGKTHFTYSEVCVLAKAYNISLTPAQSSSFIMWFLATLHLKRSKWIQNIFSRIFLTCFIN